MSKEIVVSTGARLHFGPLSYLPQQGRHFGGVGVMIDEPGYRLRAFRSECDDVSPAGPTADRVRQFVQRYRQSRPHERQPPACKIVIEQDVPAHNGLGSGTQLGLAIARALSQMAGEDEVGVEHLARRVGRGRRSAVGIHGFALGGLIVDAGHQTADEIGALACRLAMPADWRVLLITPRGRSVGLSGAGEERAFDSLGSMPAALSDRLCRLVLMDLLPAVQCRCFTGFSRAVADYGKMVGGFFAPVQGGIFGHPATDALVERLRATEIVGAGQTSWGPTVFAFVPDVATGEQVAAELAADAEVRLVTLRNSGATIERGRDE
jgi:beta-ribofuranosylaminobenzene 5'-phosphate synthase